MTRKDTVSGHPDHLSGHPLPGVRYRTETRQRLVPHTEGGETEMIEEDYDVLVPRLPRDWDQIVLTGVTLGAVALLAVAVIWSVASIGDLLARAVVAPIAYLAASAFVIAWIGCMALEWLARYNEARARNPRLAGHAALVLDMAAVCVHGSLDDSLYVGIAGAAVSAVAKVMWTVVMKSQATPLPEDVRRWLLKREARITAQLSLGAQQRRLGRLAGQAAVYAALPPAEHSQPDTSGQARDSVRAVQAVLSTVPGLSADEVMEHLTRLGVPYDEDTVRAAVDSERDNQDSSSAPTLRGVPPTITDTIRQSMDNGVQDDTAILAVVRTVHGQGVLPSTVTRIVNRERSARARKGA